MDLPANNWATLPECIISSIASILSDSEHESLRQACHGWRDNVPPRRFSPHLMIRRSRSDPINIHKLEDHSISFSCTPDPADAIICGVSHGWIAFRQQNDDVFLLDPVTGTRIELPSIPIVDRSMPDISNRNELIGNVILSESPSRQPNYIVLATLPMTESVAIWKPMNLVWTIVKIGMPNVNTAVYSPNLFFLTDLNKVALLNVGPPVCARIIDPPKTCATYRIFRLLSWQGLPLLLYRCNPSQNQFTYTQNKPFLLFKLSENIPDHWTNLTSIGGNTLFISFDHPSCIWVSAVEGYHRNCIYISGSHCNMSTVLGMNCIYSTRRRRCNMAIILGLSKETVGMKKHLFSIFNLEDDKVENVLCDWLPDHPNMMITWMLI